MGFEALRKDTSAEGEIVSVKQKSAAFLFAANDPSEKKTAGF